MKKEGKLVVDTSKYYHRFETRFIFEKPLEEKWLIRKVGQLFPPEMWQPTTNG